VYIDCVSFSFSRSYLMEGKIGISEGKKKVFWNGKKYEIKAEIREIELVFNLKLLLRRLLIFLFKGKVQWFFCKLFWSMFLIWLLN